MSTEDKDGFEVCSLSSNSEEFLGCLAQEGRYLHAHGAYSTAAQFKINNEWSEHRRKIHDAVLQRLKDRYVDVPNDGRAIFIGGESGVGKTHFRKNVKGIKGNYVISDTDFFRKELILELIARGEMPEVDPRFEQYLGRPALPFELSGLFHVESQLISGMFETWAIEERKNIIFDTSLANREFTHLRLKQLHDQGYLTIGILLQSDPEIANARRQSRYLSESQSSDGLGGRPIPRDFTELVRTNAPIVFEEARNSEYGFLMSFLLDSSGFAPVVIGTWSKNTPLSKLPDISQLDFTPVSSIAIPTSRLSF